MAPRPYWKGYLKLSLVACPVSVFTATTSSERVSFRQINKKTGNRLRQQLVDDETREVVDAADKVRGYEVDKGVYILDSKAADFDPTSFVDHYEEAVVEMLKHKQAGAPVAKQKAAAPASNVVNLMDALKRSIAAEKGTAKSASGKKAKSKPDDLRRQPQFKFAIAGGKAKQPKTAATAAPAAKAKSKRKSA